ncbi:potassium channel subfamily K member 16-like [Bufo gargarizans]|uniref:potassium channel subfamily K member 16-like n=1 Tax=Bufo gargarizans TaxID=30331 RepID=UPI001CF0E00D|nr:potassium channel subfamily K member 16-like [Bufo gargarizans]XP_044128644.1 potassium channel subfamily K member 16-like [Bufo gargarizans]
MASGLIRSALLGVGFLTYLLAGAMVFQMLEQDAETDVKLKTEQHRLDFLKNYTCLTHDALEHLIQVITDAVKHGINPLLNRTAEKQTNWDFSSAFFFAGTVVTTIGYGTMVPKTAGGQIFCVFYALFGIPLNVIVLGQVGRYLSRWCERLGKCLLSKGIGKKKAKIITILFFLAAGVFVFLGIPPLVFSLTEQWTYREGVYYAFISLSTIGFGDYVVGSGPKGTHPFDGYRALVYFWIMFGLAWLSLLINLLTSILKDTEKKIEKDLHKIRQHKKAQHRQEVAMEPLTSSKQEASAKEPREKEVLDLHLEG